MNEQTRAITLAAGAPAATAPEDAWDRLAALAFGDAASEGGCSEHAFDCTCLAAHGAAEAIATAIEEPAVDKLAAEEPVVEKPVVEKPVVEDIAQDTVQENLRETLSADSGGEQPVPDPDRPIDPEADPSFPAPESVPDPDRPVFPESEPEPTPPLTPDPEPEEQRAARFGAA